MKLIGVGAFGKIPGQGDFLRLGGTSPAMMAFDQWLQEGLEAVRRTQLPLPATPLSFVYRGAGIPQVLVGVLAPSKDAVGRSFPLAIYGTIDGSALAGRFPLVPVAFARFLGAAAKLLPAAATMSAADLGARLAVLPAPTDIDLAVAEDLRTNALMQGRSQEVLGRLFAGGPAGSHFYAFRTFLAACEPTRGQEPDKPGITVDCPVGSELDRLTWLELAARVLRWQKGPPTLLWSDPPPSRLLLSLGPAPSSLLSWWLKPDKSAAKLWPVTTDRPDAIVTAHQSLKASHRSALEGDVELERLLSALSVSA